jgi:hypothetical protein
MERRGSSLPHAVTGRAKIMGVTFVIFGIGAIAAGIVGLTS